MYCIEAELLVALLFYPVFIIIYYIYQTRA